MGPCIPNNYHNSIRRVPELPDIRAPERLRIVLRRQSSSSSDKETYPNRYQHKIIIFLRPHFRYRSGSKWWYHKLLTFLDFRAALLFVHYEFW